jgi:hypothetical protein
MNTNHTPAPWAYAPSHPAKANDTEHVIEMEGGSSPIAIVYSGGVGISHSQAQSNARLIAAAPELFAWAECEEAMALPSSKGYSILEKHGWIHENRFELPASVFVSNMRKAAITKATGEQT